LPRRRHRLGRGRVKQCEGWHLHRRCLIPRLIVGRRSPIARLIESATNLARMILRGGSNERTHRQTRGTGPGYRN